MTRTRIRFFCLHVFSDISTNNDKELKYLHAVLEKKSSILILPLPAILGPPPSFIRLDGGMIYEFNLAQPPEGFKDEIAFPKPIRFPIDLSPIKVKVGGFYLNERKHVCIWHESETPGAVADKLLEFVNKEMCMAILREVEEAIRSEGDPKARPRTWDDFRKEVADQVRREFQSTPKPSDPNAKQLARKGPISLASLMALKKAAFGNEVAMKRKGSRITLSAPFTKEDSKQIVMAMDHAKKVALEELDMKRDDPNTSSDLKIVIGAWKRALGDTVQYAVEPNGSLRIDVELTKGFTLLNTFMEVESRRPLHEFRATAEYARKCQAVLQSLQDRRVEVLREYDTKKLLAPYLASGK